MTNKTVVFALNTPFALLVAIRYYEEYLYKTHTPIWVFMCPNTDRFKNIKGIYNLPGKVYHYKDMLGSWIPKVDTSFLEWLGGMKIDMLVTQNLNRIGNIYLLSRFKRHSQFKSVLISDGLALDARAPMKTIILLNLKLNYRRFISLIPGLPIVLPNEKHKIKELDTYFAARKIAYSGENHRSIGDLLHNLDDQGLVESVFGFNFTDNYDVYFFTQPISNQRIISTDIKKRYELLLEKISSCSLQHKKRTLIKVHPAEKAQDYIKYKNEFCDIYAGESIPAELFFLYISGKMVISCFSSVSITDVQNRNHHFWCYPAIGYSLLIGDSYDHISVLEDFQMIETAIYMKDGCSQS